MNIKDYIHYYIGQSFQFDNKQWEMIAVSRKLVTGWRDNTEISSTEIQVYHNEAKLMLRRLSDMQLEEMKGIWEVIFDKPFHSNGSIVWIDKETYYTCKRWVMSSGVERVGIELNGNVWADSDLHHYKFNPNLVTHYLLKQGFDLFGLIDAGLAIDAKSIQPPNKQP